MGGLRARARLGTFACVALAAVAALMVSYRVTLSPPGLTPRALTMASASTEVLVDTPRTTVLDLRQDLFDITSLTNRSLLIGNVMASPPVLAYIGRRAGVPAEVIRVVAPRTPDAPRPILEPGEEQRSRDLLSSTNQYRLDIDANPTVPILKIYAQAPTARAAEELANGAVDGLRDYLAQVAETDRVAPENAVRLEQLGRATGKVINGGVRIEIALLTFLGALGLLSGLRVFLRRLRRNLAQAAQAERRAAPAATEPVAPPVEDESLAVR